MELQTARHSSQMRTWGSEGEGMRRSTTCSALWQKEQRSVSVLADRIPEDGFGVEQRTAAYALSVAQGSGGKPITGFRHGALCRQSVSVTRSSSGDYPESAAYATLGTCIWRPVGGLRRL